MEYAALQRGLEVTRIDRFVIIIHTPELGDMAFHQMNGPLSSHAVRYLADDKAHARELVSAARISVAPSRAFPSTRFDAALTFAQSLPGGAVLKPLRLSRGRGVTTGVSTEEQFRAAWETVLAQATVPERTRVLVEQQVPGDDYRFFVVHNRVVSTTLRRRASVVGDGRSNISELIAQKNAQRSKNPYLAGYPIPAVPTELDQLNAEGLSLSDVPNADHRITLRSASNLSAGGDSIDVTDITHPGFNDVAIRAVKAIPGMMYAGVDIIAPSITTEPQSSNYVVGEVEYSPAPLSHFPVEGKPRDMAGAVLHFYLRMGA